MEPLLNDITPDDLKTVFKKHAGVSSIGYVLDGASRERAALYAKTSGLWDQLSELDPGRTIPHLKRSSYRSYKRTGDREEYQTPRFAMVRELRDAASALWMGHPSADLDYLQDLIWAFSEQWTWVLPAHEGLSIDLFSSETGYDFAVLLAVFGDKLEQEVVDCIRNQIQKRIFDPYLADEGNLHWKKAEMNWNHVCSGNIAKTALLYYENDPSSCADIVYPAVRDMTHGLNGFTEDGGCQEGASYWQYGFGHYLTAAYALYFRTEGEIDILTHDPKVERICRYPLAMWIENNTYPAFADCHGLWLSWDLAIIINRFFDIPELYHLCTPRPLSSKRGHTLTSLALYEGQQAEGEPDMRDYVLHELGEVKMRGNTPGNLTVCAKAGHNGVPHNHNDVGSFVIYRDGVEFISDPGAPVYTSKTFSSERYSILLCNSHGHSLPVINGELQSTGSEFKGTLAVSGLNGDGVKSAVIEMAGAYSPGTVESLKREIRVEPGTGKVEVSDTFNFRRKPDALTEQFITRESVTVNDDCSGVIICHEDKVMELTASEKGTFSSEELSSEETEQRVGTTLTRITFVPEALEKEINLVFTFV